MLLLGYKPSRVVRYHLSTMQLDPFEDETESGRQTPNYRDGNGPSFLQPLLPCRGTSARC